METGSVSKKVQQLPLSPRLSKNKHMRDMLLTMQKDSAYYETSDSLVLRINLTADTKLNFNAVKGASALTENMMMRQFAVAGPQDDPVSEHKYPSVFLLTPALLETASEATLNGKEITASGIIGHIKDGDKSKHVEVKMVNENGDMLGTPVIIQGKDLTNRTKPLMSGRRVLYAGKQYEFRAKLPLSRFNTWIRVEVVTEAGEKASIVRRMFFDQSVPELNTAVAKRDLTSDTALIHIVAKDDSLKLKLYQDDSLLESVDKTGLYSFRNGVEITKDMTVPLEFGDNIIKLSAVDLSNYRRNETLHIYRNRFDVKASQMTADKGAKVTVDMLMKHLVVPEMAGAYTLTIDEAPNTNESGMLTNAKVSIHYVNGGVDKVDVPIKVVDLEAIRKAEEAHKAEEGHKTQEAPIVEEGYKVNNVHQTDTTVKASDLPKTKTVSAVHMARTDNKQITSHQTHVEKQIKNTLPSTGDSKRGYYITGMAIVMLSVLFSLAKKFKSKY